MPNFSRRTWALIAAGAVLVVIYIVTAIVMGGDDGVSKEDHDKFQQDRIFCEARATDEVNASGGLYRVGGNHWVDLVNHCLLERAGD